MGFHAWGELYQACIACRLYLLGQGDREGALSAFDPAFHDYEPDFLLLMKLIPVFKSGNQDEATMRVEHIAARTNNNEATYLYTPARDLPDVDM